VEGASGDNQPLEQGVKDAINAFVVGCKADGIWNAIKASCILAGARTLNGALQPLVGAEPTRFGTEGGWDYNRKTGLQGNGTNNYLNSNRASNADPQNNAHLSCEVHTVCAAGGSYIGATGAIGRSAITRPPSGIDELILQVRGVNDGIPRRGLGNTTGFKGASRSNGSNMTRRFDLTTESVAYSSTEVSSTDVAVFATNFQGTLAAFCNGRIRFYSIGESLDLALLDARVTTLINAFATAIP
jgi:hypothetical protein